MKLSKADFESLAVQKIFGGDSSILYVNIIGILNKISELRLIKSGVRNECPTST